MLNRERVKIVIFDCDGVMFDSLDANIAFYNTILNHFDKPSLSGEAIEVVQMSTAEGSIDYLFRDDPHCLEAQTYRKRVDYQQFIPLMRMEPFLEEVLRTLKNTYRLALATNRTTTVQPVLNFFNLEHYFNLVVSALDVAQPKPHPESIFKILDHFNVEAREVVYVGDSMVDWKTTRQAKVFLIAYKNPTLPAEHHIQDLRELLALL